MTKKANRNRSKCFDIKKLQNALLCELLTLNKEIYFTDDFDFYLPNENLQNQNLAFLIIPFTTSEFIYLKFVLDNKCKRNKESKHPYRLKKKKKKERYSI